MSDIKERLRATRYDKDNFPRMDSERIGTPKLCEEAADHIESLEVHWKDAERRETEAERRAERAEAENERLHDACAEMRVRYSDKCDELDRLRAVVEDQEQTLRELADWFRAYPEDIFTPLQGDPFKHTGDYDTKEKCNLITRASASMARHMIERIPKKITNALAALEDGDDGN